MKYLLNWNGEYLDMMIVAGPIGDEAARQAMKEAVMERLVQLDIAEDAEEAEEMYRKAEVAGRDDEDYELHVNLSGASIMYGDCYGDHYQIVEYPQKGGCDEQLL